MLFCLSVTQLIEARFRIVVWIAGLLSLNAHDLFYITMEIQRVVPGILMDTYGYALFG